MPGFERSSRRCASCCNSSASSLAAVPELARSLAHGILGALERILPSSGSLASLCSARPAGFPRGAPGASSRPAEPRDLSRRARKLLAMAFERTFCPGECSFSSLLAPQPRLLPANPRATRLARQARGFVDLTLAPRPALDRVLQRQPLQICAMAFMCSRPSAAAARAEPAPRRAPATRPALSQCLRTLQGFALHNLIALTLLGVEQRTLHAPNVLGVFGGELRESCIIWSNWRSASEGSPGPFCPLPTRPRRPRRAERRQRPAQARRQMPRASSASEKLPAARARRIRRISPSATLPTSAPSDPSVTKCACRDRAQSTPLRRAPGLAGAFRRPARASRHPPPSAASPRRFATSAASRDDKPRAAGIERQERVLAAPATICPARLENAHLTQEKAESPLDNRAPAKPPETAARSAERHRSSTDPFPDRERGAPPPAGALCVRAPCPARNRASR